MAAIHDNVVVISGQEEPSLATSWVTFVIDAHDTRWIELDKQDARLRKFVNHDFSMIDEIKRHRNQISLKMMVEKDNEDTVDPAADEDASEGPALKRARKHAADEIEGHDSSPKCHLLQLIIPPCVVFHTCPPRLHLPWPSHLTSDVSAGYATVTVEDDRGQSHSVRVFTAAYERTKLTMELTTSNVNLIRAKPRVPDSPEVYNPTIREPNVSWLAYRSSCKIRWYDRAAKKWCNKTMAVRGDTHEDMQAQCDKIARVLQVFYEQHHSA
eukprot:1121028-Pyramimonas_sp.AAC.1